MRILFVDDTKDTADLFCLCFSLSGHTAQGAMSGGEAIEMLGQHPNAFDLVIVDYHMPVIDGFETARRIKQYLPNIPIIMFTAFRGPEIDNRAQETGICLVVHKPLSPNQLLSIAIDMVRRQNSAVV